MFLINGWKLCYNPNNVAVAGVLFSEDYDTAYWSEDATDPIYPATVSSLVNSAVSYQNVVTGDISVVPTTEEIVAAVLAQLNTSNIAAAILAAAQAAPIYSDLRSIKGKPLSGEGVTGNEFHV
jgi:hypothetical protein